MAFLRARVMLLQAEMAFLRVEVGILREETRLSRAEMGLAQREMLPLPAETVLPPRERGILRVEVGILFTETPSPRPRMLVATAGKGILHLRFALSSVEIAPTSAPAPKVVARASRLLPGCGPSLQRLFLRVRDCRKRA